MKLKLHLPISGIFMSRLFSGAQNLGKSFMLPIAILPAAGLLLGFGGVFTNPVTVSTYPFLNSEIIQAIFTIMRLCGSVVFDNLSLLFPLGLQWGWRAVIKVPLVWPRCFASW